MSDNKRIEMLENKLKCYQDAVARTIRDIENEHAIKPSYKDTVFVNRFRKELIDARVKHPLFCHCLINKRDKEVAPVITAHNRRTLKDECANEKAAATTVLLCEVWEAVESIGNGDFENALIELAQVSAVCARVSEYIEEQQKRIV